MSPIHRLPHSLTAGSKIENPITREQYRLSRQLGEGGFGRAFTAQRLCDGDAVEDVCIKITTESASWHGEVFLGKFLEGSSRAVQTIDSFPLTWVTGHQRKRSRTLFAIVSELMTSGTVEEAVRKGPWSEPRTRREIRLLLKTLDHLHFNGISHRDITPANVFLTARSSLKLGDFGIAALAKHVRGAHADYYAPAYKPPNVSTYWTPADDIYQVGLLAMTLLKGEIVYAGVKKPAVNPLTPNDRILREVIKTAIDLNRAGRFQDAYGMAQALTRAE